jgi:hypothetical protein
MPENGEKPTSIALMPSTKERLLAHGRGSMSADDVVNLVLDQVEGKQRRGASRSGGAAAP